MWMQTYTGRRFWLLEPDPKDVCLEDIAHSLSLICRFNGHCREFYSIAQHSVLVAHHLLRMAVLYEASRERKWNSFRLALLHDGQEAYLGDVIRPLKPSIPEREEQEFQVWYAIIDALGVEPNDEAQRTIKHCDNVLLATEARDLMGPPPAEWEALPKPLEAHIEPWDAKRAERAWLYAWHDGPDGITEKEVGQHG